ncbi:MAG: hypothetical protein HUU38_03935 [Anaerolineales bacterium]|nr:hypothetical protein [Anaerolineales bacterium]
MKTKLFVVLAVLLALLGGGYFIQPSFAASEPTAKPNREVFPPVSEDTSENEVIQANYQGKVVNYLELMDEKNVSCMINGPETKDQPTLWCFDSLAETENFMNQTLDPNAKFVCVFDYTYYQGSSICFPGKDYNYLTAIGWNDKITSVMFLNGASATFYWHANYSVSSGEVNFNIPNLGVYGWNNGISSIWFNNF